LIRHLIDKGVYTPGFHLAHEYGVRRTRIVPSYIKEQKILYCPSYVCDKSKFNTPEDLVDHLTRLGMPGFWQPGMTIEPIEINCEINRAERCINCTRVPNIMAIPCGDITQCDKCYKRLDDCPICNKHVENYIPF